MSIFSHAAPHNHLLAECVSSPYNGLPEPVWILQLKTPVQDGCLMAQEDVEKTLRVGARVGVYRSTLHVW